METEGIVPDNFKTYKIGEKYPVLKVETSKSNSEAALSLISQARRHIELFTYNFDPLIYNTTDIAQSISQFVKISPNSQFKILLTDPTLAVKQGHRLIELSRKFSSFISIRKTNQEYHSTAYSFLIIDSKAMLYRPNAQQYYGIVDYHCPLECKNHLEFFNEVWERSEPSSDLRQLFI